MSDMEVNQPPSAFSSQHTTRRHPPTTGKHTDTAPVVPYRYVCVCVMEGKELVLFAEAGLD